MKKIYSLLAALLVFAAVSNAAVTIDAQVNVADDIWTSATGNWDWDQGPNAPANKYEQGQEVTIYLEHLVDGVYADFPGDSVTVMCGWFKMLDAAGTGVWAFQDVATLNQVFPVIKDWSADSKYTCKVTLPMAMKTTAEAKVATTSDTPDADFYMFQLAAYKDGVKYGNPNASGVDQGSLNINFTVNPYTSATDVAAAVSVYPNPVAKGASVTIKGDYTIANVAGAIVAAGKAGEVSTSDLNAGIYFVSVAGTVTKLVVE